MARKLDIISIGDATLDTFIRVSDASLMCTVDRENCLLCFNYADKIPIVSLDRTVAGNAANNAVGSARLGMQAAFYSVIGDDEVGRMIRATMKKEGVSEDYLVIDKKRPSNYSVVLNYQGERTILYYSEPRTYKLPPLAPASWMYYTAIGSNHHSLERSMLAYLKRHKTKLGYNPGTGQIREGLKRLKPLLAVTEVLFVNKQEAEQLVGRRGEMHELAAALRQTGPKIVVITDGPRGAHAFDGSHLWKMGVFPAKVVEMTGAGDSFATGFVAALHRGLGVADALKWGSANSAGVIGKIGPQAGLQTVAGIKKMITTYKAVKPVEES
ncbi:carbohydrate kinase family protein [Patescibacteria group bacterium]|nr:MAG: carbohydrate kinase family protein [Patescibacteria group bacterium]